MKAVLRPLTNAEIDKRQFETSHSFRKVHDHSENFYFFSNLDKVKESYVKKEICISSEI